MGKVDCFVIPGLETFFLSHDPGHGPHFHVRKRGDWEIRIMIRSCTEGFLDYEVKFDLTKKGVSGKEKALILQAVLTHREALLREWEQKVSRP
jgi:hypothetical protein